MRRHDPGYDDRDTYTNTPAQAAASARIHALDDWRDEPSPDEIDEPYPYPTWNERTPS